MGGRKNNARILMSITNGDYDLIKRSLRGSKIDIWRSSDDKKIYYSNTHNLYGVTHKL